MRDVSNIIQSVKRVYNSNTNFQILKDFERVIDELDVYVFKNWIDGELASGPDVERHWVTCEFMWDYDKMPDPDGGKRLLDYDCTVQYIQTEITEPRPIRKPEDLRPGTKKGKLDSRPVWLVRISIPKSLISSIWVGYQEKYYSNNDIENKEVTNASINDNQDADIVSDQNVSMDDGPTDAKLPNNEGI